MSKTDRLKQFVGVVFAEDISDLRTIPVKEALANIGLGLLLYSSWGMTQSPRV